VSIVTNAMSISPSGLELESLALEPELTEAFQRVLRSGWYVLGQEVESFEREFADWVGVSHVIGLNSGTDALTLALRALDIGPGDEVIVPSNALPTAYGVAASGAYPRFADARESDYNINPSHAATLITPRTKAIIAVHLYGHPADVDALAEIAGPEIEIIEDCAQAHGAALRGARVGTLTRLAAFSFYPTKNLGAVGDGGAVATSDPALAERIRRLRMYGETRRYHSVELGPNSRLDELQAALLRVKLPHLDARLERRRAIAALYDESFRNSPVQVPPAGTEILHARHLYPIRVEAAVRDSLVTQLRERGVPVAVHYPVGAHDQPCFADQRDAALPVTERLGAELVSLPIYPALADDDVRTIAEVVRDIVSRRRGLDE
jgi:dTDP-4-amino-4,6-dideoxygalactose transaminase